jgi:hypothetical protein
MQAIQAVAGGFVKTYAALSVIPFAAFAAVWFGVYLVTKNKKQATAWAMDVTTLLLIGSVAVLYNNVFHSTFGIYLLLLLFLIGFGVLGNVQQRAKGRIDVKRIIRAVWRLGFMGLSVAYFILATVNFVQILSS